MSLAAVTITVVTLLALGGALALASTLNYIAGHLEHQLEIVVYVRYGAASRDVAAVRQRLARLPGVTGLEYVSQDAALTRLQAQVGSRVDLRDLVTRNPLPASFVVTADRPQRLGAIAAAARALPDVEDVRDGAHVVTRLLAVMRAVRLVGTLAGLGLATIALIVIASTIRLTVFARRAELEVMRLVGATAWFIRWPFVVEGALIGACGACAAAAMVTGAYALAIRGTQASLPFLPLPAPGQVGLDVSWKLLVWGITMGVAASLLAVRRYVRV